MAANRQRVNAYQLAGQYLDALGWPNNTTTRRVLAAWFMRESARVSGSSSDIWVVGNNPLNISCTSCSNYRSVGAHKIVVYNSNDAGIAAFNSLIHGSGPGYSGIVKTFSSQPSDPAAIIKSINKSGWVTGNTNSYIHGSYNGLLDTYNGLAGPDTYVPSDTASSSTTAPPSPNVTIYGGLISYPRDHIITEQDVNDMEKKLLLTNPSPFEGLDGAIAEKIFHDTMMSLVGKPWNEQTLATAGNKLHVDANNAAIQPSTPGINVALNVFQALTGKAAAVAAILVGVGIVVAGAYLMMKDVYQQNGGGMVDPTPIFVRE